MNPIKELEKKNKRNALVIIAMVVAVLVVGVACLFVGTSNMSFREALDALFGSGTNAQSRITFTEKAKFAFHHNIGNVIHIAVSLLIVPVENRSPVDAQFVKKFRQPMHRIDIGTAILAENVAGDGDQVRLDFCCHFLDIQKASVGFYIV